MTKNSYIKRVLFQIRWLTMSNREKICLSVETDERWSTMMGIGCALSGEQSDIERCER